MSVPEYDVIVVGAGVEGSSTAYNLVENGGGKVLLLEQVEQQLSLHHKSRLACSPTGAPYEKFV